MVLSLIPFLVLFSGVFFIGLIGGYIVKHVLKRFHAQFNHHLQALKKIDDLFERQLYKDISKERESVLYVGENTPRFLVIILFTSILDGIIIFISKSYIESFSFYIVVCLAFYMVLRLPLLIDSFVRGNLYKEGSLVISKRRSDILYRAYIFKVRPFMYGVAIIPLLIGLII